MPIAISGGVILNLFITMYKVLERNEAGTVNQHCAVEAETTLKTRENQKILKSMSQFKTAKRGLLGIVFLIVAIFTFSSCTKLYYVKPIPKHDEISISPEFRQFVSKNKQQISVVLRTPRTTSNVTQETQNSELYNTIERRLMNAGFIVRDRALLEKLLVNEQSSYESIAQKVKADLIIEVMENTRYNNIPTKMYRKKDNKEVDIIPFDKLSIITYKFSFRIVIVETGASSGFFTFHYIPCTSGCDIYCYAGVLFGNSKKEARNRSILFPPREFNWWTDADFIVNDLSGKIINILQGK